MILKSDRLNNVKEYYFSKKLREVNSLIQQGKPIINIGIGSPDLNPPPSVLEVISNSLKDANAHQYQSYQGLVELRESIANFYQRNYQVTLNPANEIMPLMGSKEGIMLISMAFLNKGDKVLIPNPGYPTYSSVTNLVEAKPMLYNLTEENNWFPNLEELEKQDLSKVKIMWINYPHMPTGATPTKEIFEKLVKFAIKHQILLINDNPYSFILNNKPKSIFSIKGAKDIAIELNSLSKSFNMAGWRVGMVLANPEFIKTILQVKSNMDSGMFYGIQKGAIEALNSNNQWFEDLNKIYAKRRKLVWKILDKLECTYDKKSTGFFIWAKLPKGITSKEMADELLYNKNIFVAPGFIFGSNGEGYIRLSLCIKEDKIKEVLARLTEINV